MAGRIRSIKPEILDDEKTASLSNLEWRLFVSMWLIADDYGNVRGDPGYIKGQALWATNEPRESVAKALETLARVSLLSPYTVRGQSYLHIAGWSKHQKVDKPGKPRMPGPGESDSESSQYVAEDSRESREDAAGSGESLETDLRPPTSDPEGDLEYAARETLAQNTGAPKTEGRARRTKLRADWTPDRTPATCEAEQKAEARGVDLSEELRKLRDWALAGSKQKTDWNAVWRNWTRSAKPALNGRSGKTPVELQFERVAMLEARDRDRASRGES